MSGVSGTRRRVLAAIRAAAEPVTIEQLAADLDLHHNTVRFHAAALEDEGLIRQGRQPTGGKGRPRAVYEPTALGARAGDRNFRLLSEILLGQLASSAADPHAAAREAGRAWAAPLATARARGRRSAPRVVGEFLEEMDFEPDVPGAATTTQIRLSNCPFRELVDTHQKLVCSLHAGMLDGLVHNHPRGDRVDLIPFHTETSCLVRFRAQDSSSERRASSKSS